ncbi:MAG TPA: lysozyme inhibitor LprI family protein [Burkholderiales bacterium]|jgi:uncharacterized protein YecT (DUF1311 family)|nr:lysozyme inhibitor LprI family protein [Burkholderiales bacterium]
MKFRTQLLLAAATLALPMSAAFAANGCTAPNSDFDQVYCYSKLYMQADADLNKVYGDLRKKLDKDGQAKLKATELAWIKQRNGKCAENRGTEILVNLDCTVDETTKRTNWLSDRLRECTAAACKNEKIQ